MKKPTIPGNEVERLLALESYNVLDTLPEESYNDLTRIASIICNTPIALVTLVDEKRQFFKSRHGLAAIETSRDIAFCAHAINRPSELMVVKDARLDTRFSDNPLVTGDLNLVFYAGMPLVTNDGFALGTLCVIDHQPKELTQDQQSALKSLANQVVQLLELRKKNDQLLQTQQELLSAVKEMEVFAYTASHDLKEPLRMVKSFVNLLEKKYAGNLDDTAKIYIHFAVDGTERMELLIGDLLEYARAGNGNSEIKGKVINEILEEIKKLYWLVIQEKNVLIELTGLSAIELNHTSTRQVLQNLIGNAIKYQAPGVQPVIVVNVADQLSHWLFSVSDNGIGISRENLENIFTAFKRLNHGKDYAGTGIGLAICKKIVEKQGGKIWEESTPGIGSTFYFTLKKIVIASPVETTYNALKLEVAS